MKHITVTVNGVRHEADVEERELLVYFLREGLGLTGTNVGCDTSPCGACTVHVDGESVKSCTVLAVQADGAEVTTIEGLADERRAPPDPGGVPEHHGLQCGYCTPGMIMAAGQPAQGEPEPDGGGDPPRRSRATSAAAPATRTSSRPSRRGRVQEAAWRPTEQPAAYIGQPIVRKEDPELITGRARYIDDITVPGMLWAPSSAARSPTRASTVVRRLEGPRHGRLRGGVQRQRPRERVGGAPACAWPVTDDIKMTEHWPLAKDKARYVGDGVAVVVATSRALAKDAAGARRGRLRAAPGRHRPARRWRTAPRSSTTTSAPTCRASGGSKGRLAGRQDVEALLRRPGPGQGQVRHRLRRLIPNAMEPRGVVVDPNVADGRVHDVHGEPDPAHRAPTRRSRAASPRRSCGSSPRRGRRLRFEARASTPRSRSASPSRGG